MKSIIKLLLVGNGWLDLQDREVGNRDWRDMITHLPDYVLQEEDDVYVKLPEAISQSKELVDIPRFDREEELCLICMSELSVNIIILSSYLEYSSFTLWSCRCQSLRIDSIGWLLPKMCQGALSANIKTNLSIVQTGSNNHFRNEKQTIQEVAKIKTFSTKTYNNHYLYSIDKYN